jgi:hypothetical protein
MQQLDQRSGLVLQPLVLARLIAVHIRFVHGQSGELLTDRCIYTILSLTNAQPPAKTFVTCHSLIPHR